MPVVEHAFTGSTTAYTSYDSTKTNLGTLMTQKDGWAGPYPIAMARPGEESVAFTVHYPWSVAISSTIEWIFLADLAIAANTRRILAYEYNKTNFTLTCKGYITLSLQTATGNHTVRGLAVHRHLYTTGTVTASGTSVTGSGTTWVTDRLGAGARIGFGTTDPTAVTNWYYISSIGGETSITLTGAGPIYAGGVSYVIEELRPIISTTCSTLASGGLFVAKGVNWDDFTFAGTTFLQTGINSDNLKAVYWLKDAATVLNTVACGLAYEEPTSNQSHFVYIINADAASTARVYKYNIRAALSPTNAAATEAFVLRTGQQAAGTLLQRNASHLSTANHGPGNGVPCIYHSSSGQILRIPTSEITDASIVFIKDFYPNTNFYGVSVFDSNWIQPIFLPNINQFLTFVHYAKGFVYQRSVLQSVSPMLNNFGHDDHLLGTTNASSESLPCPTFYYSGSSNGGFYVRQFSGGFVMFRWGPQLLFVAPLDADWNFAHLTNSRLITPTLSTTNATKLNKIYVNDIQTLGRGNFLQTTEPYRFYVRTSGISDDSGEWKLIDASGDLSNIQTTNEIQIMFEFRTMGTNCLPARITSLIVSYDEMATDSHYELSTKCSTGNSIAWRFSTAFGSSVPTLNFSIYDLSGTLLVKDDSVNLAYGTLEKSTNDGKTWSAYNTTDKTNDTTYIRYTPTYLSNVKVKVVLWR